MGTALEHNFPEAIIESAQRDLNAELASMRLRSGINAAWCELRAYGLKIGVCSNLASSYAPALMSLLPGDPDVSVLSFEAGALKPEVEIYSIVIKQLGIKANAILFVGDTDGTDISGPRKLGCMLFM